MERSVRVDVRDLLAFSAIFYMALAVTPFVLTYYFPSPFFTFLLFFAHTTLFICLRYFGNPVIIAITLTLHFIDRRLVVSYREFLKVNSKRDQLLEVGPSRAEYMRYTVFHMI